MKALFVFTILALLLPPFLLFSQPDSKNDCTWTDSLGMALVSNITPEEGVLLAKRRAMAEAVAKAAGIHLDLQSLMKDFKVEAQFISALAQGEIVKEEPCKNCSKCDENCIEIDNTDKLRPFIIFHYRGCVRPLQKERDAYFTVKLEIEKQTFTHGEKTQIKISCEKDCYVTLFNLRADNHVRILFPNSYSSSTLIQAGKSLTFPPPYLSLKAETLPGQKENTEILQVVATKQKKDFFLELCRKKEGKGFCDENTKPEDLDIELLDYLDVLSRISLSERAEDTVVYKVSKK